MMRYVCCLLFVIMLPAGCKKTDPAIITYEVTGKVTDLQGAGIKDVSISIGDNYFVITDEMGNWYLEDFTEEVMITPADSGYLFTPATITVSAPGNQFDFIARQKSMPTLLPESILAWMIKMQLPNGLFETSESSNLVSLYDNSLVALAFMAAGENAGAEKIFDFFDQRIDNELLAGNGGFSQFRDAEGNPTGHNWLGDNAWLLIALNNYGVMVDGARYQRLSSELAGWIISLQDTDGGVWGGYNVNGLQIGKITEGMIDAFNAVPGYTEFHKDLLQYFETYRWDTTDKLLISWPGNYYKYALDNHSWGYCGIEDFPFTVLEKTDRYVNTQLATVNGLSVTGFAPDIDKDVVWLEGTGQMVIAYQKSGMKELADFYLKEMMKPVILSQLFPDTKSLPYSANQGTGYGSDPFWMGVDVNPSTSPSAWFLMASLQFDPMAAGYSKGIPPEDKFWLP